MKATGRIFLVRNTFDRGSSWGIGVHLFTFSFCTGGNFGSTLIKGRGLRYSTLTVWQRRWNWKQASLQRKYRELAYERTVFYNFLIRKFHTVLFCFSSPPTRIDPKFLLCMPFKNSEKHCCKRSKLADVRINKLQLFVAVSVSLLLSVFLRRAVYFCLFFHLIHRARLCGSLNN